MPATDLIFLVDGRMADDQEGEVGALVAALSKFDALLKVFTAWRLWNGRTYYNILEKKTSLDIGHIDMFAFLI